MREVRTYCRICAATCGIVVTVEDGPDEPRVTRVRGDREHPVSQGYTCAKGRALPAFHHHPGRLEHPRRREQRDGQQVRTTWPELLDHLAGQLGHVLRTTGPDGIGVFLGTASNFDTAGRLAAEQLLTQLGSRQKYTSLTVDAVAKVFVTDLVGGWSGLNPVWDEERCRLLLLIGGNPVVSHGQTNGLSNPRTRLRAQARRGELWVSDPRRTESAQLATGHLACRPGSDYALLAHLVRELLCDGADHAFLEQHGGGVGELSAAVEPYSSARAAELTGVEPAQLEALLSAIRRAGRISVLTGTGVDMSATANVTEWMVWALLAVTGSLDRPGGMWFNPGFLTRSDTRAYRTSPEDGRVRPGPVSRPELASRFGERPSSAIVSEIEAGNLRAMIVAGGNPLRCLPDSERTRAAFEQLEVFAVADVVDSELVALATHVLPCAGQLERADVPFFGDILQSAVMTHYGPAVVAPPAERRPLWWAVGHLGRRLGVHALAGVAPGTDLDTLTDDDVLRRHLERAVDGGAFANAPTAVVHSGAVFGWATERVIPDGRWRLAPPLLLAQLKQKAALPPVPLVVTSRRILRVMNTQFQDLATTRDALGPPDVLVNPIDAAAAGVEDGSRVRVSSAHGTAQGRVAISRDMRPGAMAMTHCWQDSDASRLTSADHDVDPFTGMVLQSGIPVTLAPMPEPSA